MDWKGFYRGKKVFLTGHDGFKGSWMSRILLDLGAEVYGYSLEPPTQPSLFEQLAFSQAEGMHDGRGDVRDAALLKRMMEEAQPDVVIHMAAQPLVRASYEDPVGTFATNVMGTVHLLDAVRGCESVRSVLNVTTDKVYLNEEKEEGYREDEKLCGHDPYSNSKSCSELVTYSYVRSFFEKRGIAVSTMRAGNVIGGGDYAKDRLLPDCVRAVEAGEAVVLRNPDSVRPYQHVLEPVCAYLCLAARQASEPLLAGNYNVGPRMEDCLRTKEMAEMFCAEWNRLAAASAGETQARVECRPDGGPHEAKLLRLDCSLIRQRLGWEPKWDSKTALKKTAEWAFAVHCGQSADAVTKEQIREYLG
ncbi:MAG: CDP-glucose 4,6-dehydratase [Lachnospiraceae bacterium]|nr:CDP-glucose 4,6-dehydratase [Lachnospiraceae bacterium]